MTSEEYIQLFHRARVNEVAFNRVIDCDEELRKMVEMAIAEKRPWVGLTDDEVSQIIGEQIGFNSCWGPEEDFAKAIEAKLKEKNT